MKSKKIVVISDIHGNMPALRAVTESINEWQPDTIIVNGDIVNRGPLSKEALLFVLDKQQREGWHILRGNHEDYILDCNNPENASEGPEYELMRFAHWTNAQLEAELVALLDTLPDEFQWFAPDGSEFRVRHASMQSNRDGLYHLADDKAFRQQIAPPPAVYVTGHTHHPFIRTVDETLVVNAGSVGASFDRDRRASYGRFSWNENDGWHADLVRVDYDFAQIEQDYATSGFLDEAGALPQLMLLELRRAHGLIYRWATRYQEDVLAEKIDLADSVRELMHKDDIRPFTGAPGWEIANGE